MKTAAIYARRSKVVETGDSIENQIQLCTNYLKNIGINNTLIYSDEGFSGKNTERPGFVRLMNDAKQKKFDTLVCYKVDRLSRNIGDFSNLINELEKNEISFISVIEQFDTRAAMGKAMMYICSVFSQLERETISQRVCDNMYSLATNGYWLGGEFPFGFSSSRKNFTDSSGKNRSYSELIPIEKEINLVKLIFNKYIELGSLSQVEKYLLQNNIKTRRGKDWSKASIKNIISNPVYVKANDKTIEYFKSQGIKTYGEPDDIHGILIYKKRKGKSGKIRNPDEWIYAVSTHEGIIDSDSWLEVQKIAEINKYKAPALGSSHKALLSGIIRCAQCGSSMRVSYGVPNKLTKKRKHYYMCTLKHNSGKVRCASKNVDGPEVDKLVINKLKELSLDKSYLVQRLKDYKESFATSSENILSKNIQNEISKNKEQIDNLVNNITLTEDPQLVQILLDKLTKLKSKSVELTNSLNKLNDELAKQDILINNCDNIIQKLKNLSTLIDDLDVPQKRTLLSSVIDKVFVNGDTGAVKIKFKSFN
ncbi:recombinase family protein [Clostridium perfringens]|nr:recombinase family protein [Clostridium perfringens]MDK0594886.1 recombinase family protein [Clostridium perfringens]MDM0624174.1 recombinase family protein [Clostridium perfringens]MDM0848096.1 recombinase family protein [Clostridium perfringens]MDM0859442.1 recombinase family protein [Clostridium perfringens]